MSSDAPPPKLCKDCATRHGGRSLTGRRVGPTFVLAQQTCLDPAQSFLDYVAWRISQIRLHLAKEPPR